MSIKEIKTIIADDEPMACKRVESLLSKYSNFKIIDVCNNGINALQSIQKMKPDVIFLDIEMPKFSGIEIVKSLPENQRPIIVFVTAYNNYAVEAFDFFAIDYLLKPYSEKRFQKTIIRIEEKYSKTSSNIQSELNTYLDFLHSNNEKHEKKSNKIPITLGNKIYFLPSEDIQYIIASGNYIDIFTGKSKHTLRETLSKFEQKIINQNFIRIHKSYIVNIDLITEVQKLKSGNLMVVIADKTVLPVSKTYKKTFAEKVLE